jgi:transcriptional regulator with XRE-family HTH domain
MDQGTSALRWCPDASGSRRRSPLAAALRQTGTLSKIELGQANPSWATVRTITRVLDLSLRELADAVEAAS